MIIVISEPEQYSDKAVGIYRSLGEVVATHALSRNELLDLVREAEVLVIRLAHTIDRQVLTAAKKLKIIACPTTGLDHIDLAAAAEQGVRVVSLKGQTDFLRTVSATAEHTFALLLSLVRKIPWALASVNSGEWDRDAFKGHELAGKTLGIVGFGRLGSLVARIARGFDMKVVVADIKTIDPSFNVRQFPFNEVLSMSDIVSVHIPYTSATERLFNAMAFASMKQNAIFVNTSRGQVVDEAALLQALQGGRLSGAALDVLWAEDSRPVAISGNPLIEYSKTHQNLLITPHLGGATFESMEKTEIFIAEQVRDCIKLNP